MKTLQNEQMADIQGGTNWAAFACGFGIVAMIAQPETALAIGEGTAAACAAAMN
ncbi:hypothetical protein ACTJJ0_30150 [Chitinophaga sp. 22321]|uniref:Class IIb bacteriocin, lactobin A/cerein 7B family n=1 Tax=Chitinophaga hostae TaxID=2831022 RepID=A0ABS5J8G6_9BACT|nr:hypothetical protein [Chitinophaga hostae]MBS0031360.1 hypothetical protein [Chitinophaga hostae]